MHLFIIHYIGERVLNREQIEQNIGVQQISDSLLKTSTQNMIFKSKIPVIHTNKKFQNILKITLLKSRV